MANFTGASELRYEPDKQQGLCENATAADGFLPSAVTVVGGHASADNPWAGAPQVRRPAVCSSPQPSPAPIPEPPRQEWLPAGQWLVVRGPVPPQSNAPAHYLGAASPRRHSTETILLRRRRFDGQNARMPPQAVPAWRFRPASAQGEPDTFPRRADYGLSPCFPV